MQRYQTDYIANIEEIVRLRDLSRGAASDFEDWYRTRIDASRRIDVLRAENNRLLDTFLFPVLDGLPDTDPDVIRELEEFADRLMDWHTNLDCGVYCLIHDSLLSVYRIRRDRNGIIKELYKLGMGLYYQRRTVQGMKKERLSELLFENEMVFTEAGSYLKFFENIDDEETKGYIIRSLANVAICANGMKRRIATSSRILRICRDDYYRSLAPNLPWDVFLRRTYQQMSANRDVLSRGDLNAEELSEVLGACQVVFEPESGTDTPNVRWLWPYYEMEYSCGFADLRLTLDRMEQLIDLHAYNAYDISGLYANVQLPIYYAHLMIDNPSLKEQPRRVQALLSSYDKMMKTLLSFPQDSLDDFFDYQITLVSSGYLEIPGAESYKDVMLALMRRYDPLLYIRSLRIGELASVLSAALYEGDPSFFDDIPFLKGVPDSAEKKDSLLAFANDCALFHDSGLLRMNMERLSRSRKLFESEFRLYQFHTAAGYDDLKVHPSTAAFADVAYGHHRWYNGADGYPEDYIRAASPYRAMTDVIALCVFLEETGRRDPEGAFREATLFEQTRFSPLVTAYLSDPAVRAELARVLTSPDESYYRTLYDQKKQDVRSHGLPA